jgi:catechol 2,3-dioxygenase-like lactoylglutathione lyase family enzyme
VPAHYDHANLVARDWRRLARFYVEVLDCEVLLPERDLRGRWLDASIGLRDAHVQGVHLRLPGHGPDGPTLELFAYDEHAEHSEPTAHRLGFGHLAFRVDDVAATHAALLAAGGRRLGEIAETDVPGVGHLTVVYARDPEGNLLELQHWG